MPASAMIITEGTKSTDTPVGTVMSFLLVTVALIALVVIFKEQLTALVQNIFGSITGGVAVITE